MNMTGDSMEIRQLRYFVEICYAGSFSKAANNAHISHQGISLAIIRLEDEFGAKLFKRTIRGIELTDEAQFLLPKAKQILSLVDECEDRLIYNKKKITSLPIYFAYGVLQEFADPILDDFKKQNPDIKLKIFEDSDANCEIAVENGDVEIALSIGSNMNNKLDKERLISTPYYTHALIVHENHPFAKKKSISLKEMENVPVVLLNENTRTYQQYMKLCRNAGFEPMIEAIAGDILSVFYYAETDKCPGISTLGCAHRINRANVCAIPFDTPEFAWELYLIQRKDSVLSKEAAAFKECALKYKRIETWT
jgi:DNA-binding transcriptional LysR family regulator